MTKHRVGFHRILDDEVLDAIGPDVGSELASAAFALMVSDTTQEDVEGN